MPEPEQIQEREVSDDPMTVDDLKDDILALSQAASKRAHELRGQHWGDQSEYGRKGWEEVVVLEDLADRLWRLL